MKVEKSEEETLHIAENVASTNNLIHVAMVYLQSLPEYNQISDEI